MRTIIYSAKIGFAALCLSAIIMALGVLLAAAQCPADEIISGLQFPLGLERTSRGNLIVSETGTGSARSGRISIVDPETGDRRTLLGGLPSGINDVNEPSGHSGLFLQGGTLYVLVGIGDTIVPGPLPGTARPNPNGPNSPIFSSILAIRASGVPELRASGLALTQAHHPALAAGQTVRLGQGREQITIELIANFPDFVPNPRPDDPGNVAGSNPFGIAGSGQDLYVTDGGRNVVWSADRDSGSFGVLAAFPPIPNPLFPIGGPVVEAVPTGITLSRDGLLVALFRGFPFAPGTSHVVEVDRKTGAVIPVITNLKAAIAVIPFERRQNSDHLVMQHASNNGPFLLGPGILLRVPSDGGAPMTIADCLNRPSAIVFDRLSGTAYVTELAGGRLVSLSNLD